MSDALARLGWQDFEHLLAEHYREQGYRVELRSAVTSLKTLGSGLDLRLRRLNESIVVQCKHWDALEVPATEVTELLGTMLNEAATGGVLVTRGRFGADAQAAARRQPRLQLVDGDLLRAMLKLPDHLDAVAPVSAKAAKAARKADVARRRASTSSVGHTSHALPIALIVGITLLILLFVWKIQTERHALPPPVVAAAPAHPIAPAPSATAAPPPRPFSGTTGFISHPGPAIGAPPPVASRELAERERLRQADDESRRAHARSEDAMKVMERNTREVGQAE
jgi:hypothetical protein